MTGRTSGVMAPGGVRCTAARRTRRCYIGHVAASGIGRAPPRVGCQFRGRPPNANVIGRHAFAGRWFSRGDATSRNAWFSWPRRVRGQLGSETWRASRLYLAWVHGARGRGWDAVIGARIAGGTLAGSWWLVRTAGGRSSNGSSGAGSAGLRAEICGGLRAWAWAGCWAGQRGREPKLLLLR